MFFVSCMKSLKGLLGKNIERYSSQIDSNCSCPKQEKSMPKTFMKLQSKGLITLCLSGGSVHNDR